MEEHAIVRKKTSTSVDLPLSNESKRVPAYGAEEAERLADKHIGPEHLFLGLLREEKCFAADLLGARGVRPRGNRPPAAGHASRATEQTGQTPERGQDLHQRPGGADPTARRTRARIGAAHRDSLPVILRRIRCWLGLPGSANAPSLALSPGSLPGVELRSR